VAPRLKLIANVFTPINDQLASFIDYSAFSTTKRWTSATAKPTHLATATHATIVASALVIRPLASVTSRAVRNEQNNNNNNVNVSHLYKEIIINRFVSVSKLYYVYSFTINISNVTYNPYKSHCKNTQPNINNLF